MLKQYWCTKEINYKTEIYTSSLILSEKKGRLHFVNPKTWDFYENCTRIRLILSTDNIKLFQGMGYELQAISQLKFNTAKQNESSEDFKFHFKNRYLAMISKADEILF